MQIMLETLAADILLSAMDNTINIDYLAADLRKKRSRVLEELNKLRDMGVNIKRQGDELFINASDMPVLRKSITTKIYTLLMEYPGTWVESVIIYDEIGFECGLGQYMKKTSIEFGIDIECKKSNGKFKMYRAIEGTGK